MLWALGKSVLSEQADLYQLLKNLRPARVASRTAGTAATPGTAGREPAFADPIHLNVFRVEDLIRQGCDASGRNSIQPAQIARYLDLPL